MSHYKHNTFNVVAVQGTADISAALRLGPAGSENDTERLWFLTSDQPQKSPWRW